MAKDVIISTSGLNCYGGRILTGGIDLEQYRRNPVLLWMHRRSFEGDSMPIGRIENLRVEGDRLIGTPVFDLDDDFARRVAGKWEAGFLRMASAGVEILETSEAPEHLIQGQTHPTITRCRLEEVSIVDIGGNDEALQLAMPALTLAGGIPVPMPHVLLRPLNGKPGPDGPINNHHTMNKELNQLLGLPDEAAEHEVIGAVRLLKEKADTAEHLRLSGIEALVDVAIGQKRIAADARDHFIGLGKTAGIEALRQTLELMQPQRKPTDLLHPAASASASTPKYAKLSEVPEAELRLLKQQNPAEYARLYRAEYGQDI